MGRRKRKFMKPWCWYCNREFEDEKVLAYHQKSKHFRCQICRKKFFSGLQLSLHSEQMHKETLIAIPNSLPHRSDVDIEIFGMNGVPEADIEEKKRQLYEASRKTNKKNSGGNKENVPENNNNIALSPDSVPSSPIKSMESSSQQNLLSLAYSVPLPSNDSIILPPSYPSNLNSFLPNLPPNPNNGSLVPPPPPPKQRNSLVPPPPPPKQNNSLVPPPPPPKQNNGKIPPPPPKQNIDSPVPPPPPQQKQNKDGPDNSKDESPQMINNTPNLLTLSELPQSNIAISTPPFTDSPQLIENLFPTSSSSIYPMPLPPPFVSASGVISKPEFVLPLPPPSLQSAIPAPMVVAKKTIPLLNNGKKTEEREEFVGKLLDLREFKKVNMCVTPKSIIMHPEFDISLEEYRLSMKLYKQFEGLGGKDANLNAQGIKKQVAAFSYLSTATSTTLQGPSED